MRKRTIQADQQINAKVPASVKEAFAVLKAGIPKYKLTTPDGANMMGQDLIAAMVMGFRALPLDQQTALLTSGMAQITEAEAELRQENGSEAPVEAQSPEKKRTSRRGSTSRM